MVRVERILERLRPAGAPGTAAAAGVPADRVAERAAELEPVLARLDPVQARCERLRSDAAAEVARRRRVAAEESRQLLAEARRAAQAERAAAAAAVERAVEAEAAAARLAAERDAAAVRERAASRLDQLVDRVVVTAVRALGEAEPTTPAAAADRPGAVDVSVKWVAGSVRARALAHRRLGRGGVRALATSGSLAAAVESLAGSPYGRDVRPDSPLARAQRETGRGPPLAPAGARRLAAADGQPGGAGAGRLVRDRQRR